MKKLFLLGLFGMLSLSFATVANASEGETILTNRVNESSTCWVGSVVMQNDNYKLLFSCRNLTYPGGTEVFSYVLWANPVDGGNPTKLGILGFGKGEFSTNKPYTSLFVTKEPNANAQNPQGTVVMQGSVRAFPGLQNVPTTTETPLVSPTPGEDTLVTETPIPTTQPRTGVAKFLTSGILAILGIAGILFILFIVIRKK